MNYLLNFLLLHLILMCKSDTPMCQRFDAQTKLLERYCENGHQIMPSHSCAAWQIRTIESFEVSQLKMAGCDYYTVSEAFIKFKYVTSVTVQYSHNFDLNVQLDRLQTLNVSYNEWQTIPVDFFSRAPELRVIDLSHNGIIQLEWGSFEHARNLRKIYLSHNLLRTIQPEIIVGLINLELIDLRANQLYSVPDLSGNKHLNAMHLQENPITTYDCFHISLMKSVSLHLSWSNVVTFDGGWHCSGKRIRVVSNAVDEGIYSAESNGKHELHCNDRSFTSLREFTAGRNAFQNVVEIVPCFGATIESIDLSGNLVETIDSTAFRRFNNLKELKLSETMLKRFDFGFITQHNRLDLLDLSFNPNLRTFYNIESFRSFTSLREFKIAGNRLANLPQILEQLSNSIELLDISGNPIGRLNTNSLHRLNKLKALNVSDSSLSISNENPFEPITTLVSLDISRNNLGRTTFAVLSKTLNRLQHFHAAHCHIQNPDDIARELRSSLIELNLAANEIRTLQTEKLQNLLNLATLDISSNKLHEIEFQLTLNKLQHINLNGNDLTHINGLTRTQFRSLKSIDIAGNQLECSNLQQLQHEWQHIIEFSEDSLMQKHNKDCRSNGNQTESGLLTRMYNKIKFW